MAPRAKKTAVAKVNERLRAATSVVVACIHPDMAGPRWGAAGGNFLFREKFKKSKIFEEIKMLT